MKTALTSPPSPADEHQLRLRGAPHSRKNWLFVSSDDGGAVNATFTSLLARRQLCDVEPWSYLRDRFCLLPRSSDYKLLDLAPLNWKSTREQPDVQQLLDADRLRQLTLARA